MTEDRDKMLLSLKNKIIEGDFNYDHSDGWDEESATFYSIDDNPSLKDAMVNYKYHSAVRNWQGDNRWDYWIREGKIALGELLEFLLSRKFGHNLMKEKHEDIIKFLKTGTYDLSSDIETIDTYQHRVLRMVKNNRR